MSKRPKANHLIGIALMVIGVALAYSMVFTEFPYRVNFQWEFENGERVPITHITCPSPWSVIDDGAKPEGVVSGDLCVKPARGQIVQGIGALVIFLSIGIWALTRTNPAGPLPELPPSISALLGKR